MSALAWPVVVLIVILLIRSKIPSLLDRARHIKAGPVEIDLDEAERLRDAISQEVAEQEEASLGSIEAETPSNREGVISDEELQPGPPTATRSSFEMLTTADRSEWVRVAEVSPAAALMLVHSDIDRMLRRLVIREISRFQRPGPPAGDPGPVLAEPGDPMRPATTATVANTAKQYGLLSDDDVKALKLVTRARNQAVRAISPTDVSSAAVALDLAIALAEKIEAEARNRGDDE